jgi:hypothetical protein
VSIWCSTHANDGTADGSRCPQCEIDRYLSVMKHLRPYINHHRSCYKGGNDNATVIGCQCGLDSILEALKENES